MKLTTSKGARALVLVALVATVGACGLPRSGPNKREIFAGSVLKQGDAYVVTVNSRVTRATAVMPAFGFGSSFRNAGVVGSDTINAGDLLALTVFENVKDDPLLGNTGQRVSLLDQVQVDGQGYIFVPYAGKVKAAGQTPDGLRQILTKKLDSQTPDPQITVQRLAGDGQTVSVSGAVTGQGVYPIERPTRTLSTMLAKSGGIAIEPAVAIVRVTRGGQTGKVWLQDLYENPGLDIALRGGDQIVVERDQRAFTALGATGAQSLVPFESQTLSAIEAIAQVGGLATSLADPTGVFVFRNEPAEIANSVLGRKDLRGDQRMVYVLDLTQPTGMFEARDFLIRDGDTVYVTEAPFVQWTKTIGAITGTAGAADSLASVGSSGG
ncbi:polysaccharide biosynthesis/export family protein [Gemmobacter fulvus]|uniref:Polysaccharide biosynthesis/export family protein n=1 Tax=Gemmobacter fulvus TaxID=2840474 RepID=A0A975P829_9RHOB|nr:polysaccharide biosynthesis/export family protein [Gemmobacter fulvus]MBT9247375.1 polysaccharide biosynthesis/export family protein [Gemmobacter fulvus]MDQ1848417.1 polysaccharide biosynthesis/export family protein [Gemmobacter fulvus]QWK90146.1 polysaccharide biosynthesis/export family protein [Gemmobacter fulvus]